MALPELGRSLRCNGIFIDWGDTALSVACHDISGYIAMQHPQHYFKKVFFRTVVIAITILPALLAIASADPVDPLLHDSPAPVCQAGADYAPGIDATGDAVAPADVGARPVPVPAQIAMPLGGGRHGKDGGYVMLDGAKLAPLLNPPTCRN